MVRLVESPGADYSVDYTQSDPTKPAQPYDLIIDAVAYRPFSDFLDALVPGGTYVLVGGAMPKFFTAMIFGSFVEWYKPEGSRRQVKCLESKANQADLTLLKDWIEAGKFKPFVNRVHPLAEVPEAIRYLEERQVKGKVAISV